MKDKEVREYMKKLTEDVSVPDSLKPEKIEEKLAHTEQRKPSPLFRHRNLVAAASLFLVLTAAVLAGRQFLPHPEEGSDPTPVADNTAASTDSLSYEEAYDAVHSYYELQSNTELNANLNGSASMDIEDDALRFFEESESTGGAAPKAKTENENVQKEQDYTNTDVQVEGIMEGDIVKTDGSYLYSLHEEATGCGITIYSVNGKKVKKVSNISTDHNNVSEMYLEGKRLIIIGYLWEESQIRPSQGKQITQIQIYDVSDPAAPKQLRTQTQSGTYITSRVADGYLYTFSKYSVSSGIDEIDKEKPETYIPQVNGEVLPEEKVRCVDKAPEKNYMVMTSLAVDGKSNYADTISTLGGADVYYVSNENIYTTEGIGNVLGNFTKISKYLYKNGTFTYKTACQIRGSIQNSYYLHEQNGNLCFVYNKTTISGRMTNGLCILDPELKQLGEITNLGNEERIYSSYFMENTAYFVTYRETDPVFAVDLSDPSAPKLKSELKLPGYSDYLHSFGDHQLIGIGIDEYGDYDECAKISIFSISKNKKITESAKKRLKDYAETLAEEDRHSVLIDEERQLVGFPAANWDTEDLDYLLYSYNRETGVFKQLLRQKNISSQTRGVRIGDYFYVVDGEEGVTSYCFPTCGTPGTLEDPSFEAK